jgi:Ca2+-binding RTX toxin-like protein
MQYRLLAGLLAVTLQANANETIMSTLNEQSRQLNVDIYHFNDNISELYQQTNNINGYLSGTINQPLLQGANLHQMLPSLTTADDSLKQFVVKLSGYLYLPEFTTLTIVADDYVSIKTNQKQMFLYGSERETSNYQLYLTAGIHSIEILNAIDITDETSLLAQLNLSSELAERAIFFNDLSQLESYLQPNDDGGNWYGVSEFIFRQENFPPLTSPEQVQIDEDAPAIQISVLVNDLEANNEALSLVDVSVPEHGKVTILENGIIEYQPNENFFGDEILTYKVSDGTYTVNEQLNITIAPINDIPEVIAHDAENIAENAPAGTAIISLNAHDVDHDILSYEIIAGNQTGYFSIDPHNGDISLALAQLDYETQTVHQLTIAVDDGNGGTATSEISVHVYDIAEGIAPVFNDFEYFLPEGSSGENFAQISATDSDGENSQLSYQVIGGVDANAISIDPITGQLSINTATAIDFEQQTNYQFIIEVQDGNGNRVQQQYNVVVQNQMESGFENGSAFDDYTSSSLNEQIFHGLAGNDTYVLKGHSDNQFDGGDGYDTLSLSAGVEDYLLTETENNVLISNLNNDESITLTNVEGIWFAGSSDFIGIGEDASSGGASEGGENFVNTFDPFAAPQSSPDAAPEYEEGMLTNEHAYAMGLGTTTYPTMAIGLNGIAYWGTTFPFLDLMKQAEHGRMNLLAGGSMHFEAIQAAGYVDDHGWPTMIPDIADSWRSFAVNVNDTPVKAGRYHVRYQGEGELLVIPGFNNPTVFQAPGYTIFEVTDENNLYIELIINSTDPNNTGNYIRNISIVHEDNLALYEAGQIFNPDYLKLLRDKRVLRFMDWSFTNNNGTREWEERAEPNDLSYNAWDMIRATDEVWQAPLARGGVPLEVMIELANQAGVDPWFNIPHLASDDYVRQFAVLIRDTLDPDLKAYIEYSNEVWNGMFVQSFDQEFGMPALLTERFGSESFGEVPEGEPEKRFTQWPDRPYYGYRSAEISHLIHQVFEEEGSSAVARIHFTMGTATDSHTDSAERALKGINEYLIDAEAVGNGSNLNYLFDSVAATWYYGWIDPRYNRQINQHVEDLGIPATADLMFEHFTDQQSHIISRLPNGALDTEADDTPGAKLSNVRKNLALQNDFTQRHGLELIIYEGGTHLAGIPDVERDDNLQPLHDEETELPNIIMYNELLEPLYRFMNYDDRTKGMYENIYQHWQTLSTATLFNHFVDVSGGGSSGHWGALRHLNDETGRWDFVNEANANATLSTWEQHERDPRDFDYGITFDEDFILNRNGADSELLIGTNEEDFLLGKAGNDTIAGGFKNDGLHGGWGNDVIYGNQGNDTLIGGRGNDQLTGGLGADNFKFSAFSVVAGEVDIIHDFTQTQGDIIDLSAIFSTQLINEENYSEYINLIENDSIIELWLDLDGSAEQPAILVARIVGLATHPIDNVTALQILVF